jgi:hypothetical protein
VGFIRDLPHGLVDAFEATLQEATSADLLLHVVDASHPNYPEQMAEVKLCSMKSEPRCAAMADFQQNRQFAFRAPTTTAHGLV